MYQFLQGKFRTFHWYEGCVEKNYYLEGNVYIVLLVGYVVGGNL